MEKIFIVGKGKYNKITHNKFYMLWYNIRTRCYNRKHNIIRPDYIDCLIDERWYNFQVFAEWCEINYIDGFHLDKDILVKDNKVYGPDTCCFVPQQINSAIAKGRPKGNNPLSLYTGIILEKSKGFRVQINKFGKTHHCGIYYDINLAIDSYKFNKGEYIDELADKWKDEIPDNVFKALKNYKLTL